MTEWLRRKAKETGENEKTRENDERQDTQVERRERVSEADRQKSTPDKEGDM